MEVMGPSGAALYLKMSLQTLAGWRSKGKGPRYFKSGRSVRYTKEDLDAYLKRNTVKTKKG